MHPSCSLSSFSKRNRNNMFSTNFCTFSAVGPFNSSTPSQTRMKPPAARAALLVKLNSRRRAAAKMVRETAWRRREWDWRKMEAEKKRRMAEAMSLLVMAIGVRV
jgi:hypothetical protein